MTNYGGLKCIIKILDIPQKTGDVESWKISQLFGTNTPGTSTIFDPKNYAGEILDIAYNVLVNKIYISQTEFSYDLITEEITETITLWNADQVPHNILNISISQSSGIIFDAPQIPYSLTPETEITLGLIILKDGPTIQNTRILITIDYDVFEISVTGKRMVSFNFLCDWRESPKIKYGFQTVIWRNLYFQEQRRPLLVQPIREMEAAFTIQKQNVEKFTNEVRNLSKKTIGIPVYLEPMSSASNLQGNTILTMRENLSNYFNLNNLSILILVLSKSDKYKSELKMIASIGSSSITVDQPVIGNFPPEDTIVFPVMIGIIESKNFVEETAKVVTANLQFKEIRLDVG